MARSNKPLVWLPFAAGGMFTALLVPALTLVLLLDALGLWPTAALAQPRLLAFAANPIAGLALFALIGLGFWHAAHRLRMTAHDLGVRAAGARRGLAWGCYLAAAAATAVLAYALLRL